MPTTLRFLATAVMVLCGTIAALASEVIPFRKEHIDLGRLIDCIGMAENGDPHALGGRICIMEGTWRDRTLLPYGESRNPKTCREIGIDHLQWIVANLKRHNVTPTVDRIAQCYGFGLTAYLATRRTGSYGERISNLYRDATASK